MPSEDTTSTLGVVLSHSKIDLPLFGQYVGSDMVIAKRACDGNWLYVLKCETCRTFYEFEASINALDSHLLRESCNKKNTTLLLLLPTSSFFIPVLGKDTSDIILIGALGTPLLEEIFDEKTGKIRQPAEVWQMTSTVPPRKRVKTDDKICDATTTTNNIMMLPIGLNLLKLSRQLHVDFSVNVYGDGEKRKREPVRSMYRTGGTGGDNSSNSVVTMMTTTTTTMMTEREREEGGPRKQTKTKNNDKDNKDNKDHKTVLTVMRDAKKPRNDDESKKESEEPPNGKLLLLKQQKTTATTTTAVATTTASLTVENDSILLSRMIESISSAHAEALAAKKEIIRTMTESHIAVIKAKNKVIHTQAALIGELLDKNHGGAAANAAVLVVKHDDDTTTTTTTDDNSEKKKKHPLRRSSSSAPS